MRKTLIRKRKTEYKARPKMIGLDCLWSETKDLLAAEKGVVRLKRSIVPAKIDARFKRKSIEQDCQMSLAAAVRATKRRKHAENAPRREQVKEMRKANKLKFAL